MMSQPDRLARFIKKLPSQQLPDEDLELVIAGDFIDFLAVPEFQSFTEDPTEARLKLLSITNSDPFAQVFSALSDFVVHHRVTILVGNHDVELALPLVQETLLKVLGARAHQVLFVDDGRAYRIGRALIEHGNRYDPPNNNDWDGLRAIASAQSRGEQVAESLNVSTGSLIVEKIINKLKKDYPFIDLVQPEGIAQALLLAEFETPIVSTLALIGDNLQSAHLLARARAARSLHRAGARPSSSRNISADTSDSGNVRDARLEELFGPNYRVLVDPNRKIGTGLWPSISSGFKNGLASLLRSNAPIPTERMMRIREALRRVRRTDALDQYPLDNFSIAAKRMVDESVCDVVVMGHTHEAREYFWTSGTGVASYINSGAWADVIRVPDAVLDGNDEDLRDFLKSLFGPRPKVDPTYVNLRIEPSGTVSHARLEFATE
jgi:UDP-2,3-diacylglucosamine pyrophosphatase LpxH